MRNGHGNSKHLARGGHGDSIYKAGDVQGFTKCPAGNGNDSFKNLAQRMTSYVPLTYQSGMRTL